MDIGSILLGAAILAGAGWFVTRPFFQSASAAAELAGRDDQLAEYESILTALRDLDFDHATGKITDQDHAQQRAGLVGHGVEILKQLDARAQAASVDEVEAAIAARRFRAVCRQCGAPSTPGDRFCARCGADRLAGVMDDEDD